MKKKYLIFILFITVVVIISYFINYLLVNYRYLDKKFIPKPGTCLILQQKHCQKAKLIRNPFNGDSYAIGFKLPKNTPIFSPVDGEYSSPVIGKKIDGDNSSFWSTSFDFRKKTDTSLFYYSCLAKIDNQDRFAGIKKIKEGEKVYQLDQETINLQTGDYNLIFLFEYQDIDTKEFLTTTDMLKKIFAIK